MAAVEIHDDHDEVAATGDRGPEPAGRGAEGGAMTAVEIHDDVTAIGDWDDLVRECAAPVFYSAAYLSAYRSTRLQPVDVYAYLMLRHADGSPRAALPAALLPQMDPVGSLAVHEPGIAANPLGLVSHVWHCYDTWLPSRPDDRDGLVAVLDAFRDLARELGAPWYALVNVAAAGPLATALDALGARGVPVDERYILDLPPGFELSHYLAGLGGRARYTMRAHQRRAEQAGAVVRILDPASADLDAHLELVRRIGAKHGVEDFYPRGSFQDFQLRMGAAVKIVEVCLAGRVVGVAILLLDAQRVHYWTCGVDYEAAPTFSPFYVLFYEVLRFAIASGVARFECGRRNGVFKVRYGLQPLPLLGYVASSALPLGRRD
jgi:Acetyltransferase (GNAT) domain